MNLERRQRYDTVVDVGVDDVTGEGCSGGCTWEELRSGKRSSVTPDTSSGRPRVTRDERVTYESPRSPSLSTKSHGMRRPVHQRSRGVGVGGECAPDENEGSKERRTSVERGTNRPGFTVIKDSPEKTGDNKRVNGNT